MSRPAGSSAAGVGLSPTALADSSSDNSQAGNSAASPGAGLAADLLHYEISKHSWMHVAEQNALSRRSLESHKNQQEDRGTAAALVLYQRKHLFVFKQTTVQATNIRVNFSQFAVALTSP